MKFTVKTIQGLADGKYPAIERQMQQDDDCRGLYIHIGPNSRSWIMRYTFAGKPMIKTVAKIAAMTLRQARNVVEANWVLVAKGIDPFAKAEPAKAAAPITFREDTMAFRAFRLANGTGWKKLSDAGFLGAFERHVFPHIGDRPTGSLKSDDLVTLLRPLHVSNYRTAEKLHAWINAIFERAMLADSEDNPRILRNPAPKAWAILGEREVAVIKHPALPWQDAPHLYKRLCEDDSKASQALRLLLLLGTPRAAEIIGAKWSEISSDGCAVHYTPPERLKNGTKRRDDAGNYAGLDRPLTQPALDLLASMDRGGDDFLFSGRKGKMIGGTSYGRKRERSGGTWVQFDGHMQGDAMQVLLRRMAVKVTLRDKSIVDVHTHGLRSTFSTWVTENHPQCEDACEINIDHLLPGAMKRTYKRTDLLAKRRELLTHWAEFLTA